MKNILWSVTCFILHFSTLNQLKALNCKDQMFDQKKQIHILEKLEKLGVKNDDWV